MQTFLPHPSFVDSAKCLDNKRLGKQRVEAWTILQTILGKSIGWSNHPAVKMWKGHSLALALYGVSICGEWRSRGFKDNMLARFLNELERLLVFPIRKTTPSFLGNKDFHASHRSNLLRKFPEHYSKFGWTEPDNLPYVWDVEG